MVVRVSASRFFARIGLCEGKSRAAQLDAKVGVPSAWAMCVLLLTVKILPMYGFGVCLRFGTQGFSV